MDERKKNELARHPAQAAGIFSGCRLSSGPGVSHERTAPRIPGQKWEDYQPILGGLEGCINPGSGLMQEPLS